MNYLSVFFIVLGLFSAIASILNLSFFMNSRKARRLSNLITPTGARIVYVIIGIGLIVLGTLGLTGVIDFNG